MWPIFDLFFRLLWKLGKNKAVPTLAKQTMDGTSKVGPHVGNSVKTRLQIWAAPKRAAVAAAAAGMFDFLSLPLSINCRNGAVFSEITNGRCSHLRPPLRFFSFLLVSRRLLLFLLLLLALSRVSSLWHSFASDCRVLLISRFLIFSASRLVLSAAVSFVTCVLGGQQSPMDPRNTLYISIRSDQTRWKLVETEKYATRIRKTQSNPIKPSQTQSNPVKPSQTQKKTVKPSQTQSNPEKNSQTQSNPVKPSQTQ